MVVVKMTTGLQSSEGFSHVDDPLSWLWQRPQSLAIQTSPWGCVSVLTMAAGFPQSKRSKRKPGKNFSVFYNLAQKSHTVISTLSYWLHGSALFFMGKDYTEA